MGMSDKPKFSIYLPYTYTTESSFPLANYVTYVHNPEVHEYFTDSSIKKEMYVLETSLGGR